MIQEQRKKSMLNLAVQIIAIERLLIADVFKYVADTNCISVPAMIPIMTESNYFLNFR
jgi:hypothetical protein